MSDIYKDYRQKCVRCQGEHLDIGYHELKNAAAIVLHVKLRSIETSEAWCCAYCANQMRKHPAPKPKYYDPNQAELF